MDRVVFGNNVWKNSLMDRVWNGKSWFGYSPRWIGEQLDRVLFGNYIWIESLMGIFSNGQNLYWTEVVWMESLVDRGIVGQGCIWKFSLDRVSGGQSL